MNLHKTLVRVWLVLSLISILIDAVCFWLLEYTPAQLPGTYTYNYMTIFLMSVPAPFILAILLTVLGGVLATLRWIWVGGRHAMHHSKSGMSDFASARSMAAASAHKH